MPVRALAAFAPLLSILSQLLQGERKELEALAQKQAQYDFQFFPSCCLFDEYIAALERVEKPFNSFPVAAQESQGAGPRAARAPLSILSQLLLWLSRFASL